MKNEKPDTPNLVRNWAHLYDLDQRDNLTADIPFYLDYASKAKGEILELGCGTGRVSIELAKAGHPVTGLDLSDSMLAIFRSKLDLLENAVKDRISVVQGDMADFHFDRKYSMIIAPFRAFQALTRNEDINGCLQSVRNQLGDGGIFIVNVFRPYGILDESWCYPARVQYETTDEKTGCRIIKKHSGDRIDPVKQVIYPSMLFEVTYPDGTVEAIKDHLVLKYYYYGQMRSILEQNGFSVAEEYGWYDKSDIKTGRELIFVCR